MARVLVIEDEDNLRGLIRRALERVGHEVHEAPNGRDGFNQVVHRKLDVVITDLLMPEEEGIETIQRIKLIEPDLPIIAMSGVMREGEFSVLDDALLMGADLALEKPFDVAALIRAVQQVLDDRAGSSGLGGSEGPERSA